MRDRAAEDRAMQHARAHEIVDILRLAEDLLAHFEPRQALADGACCDRRVHAGILSLASFTASMILAYPEQRQRLPASASRISGTLGFFLRRSSASAVRIIPGVQ